MAIALKLGGDGHLQQLQASDTLQIDAIDLLSVTGTLSIGASMGASDDIQLGSVASLVTVLGDGEVDGDLTVSGSLDFTTLSVQIYRNGNDLMFKDVSNPTAKTLTELLSGSGALTETAHRVLRQLIHFIDDGPAEGFTSGAYREIVGGAFPTSVIWYTDSGKTDKIVEKTITWGTSPKVPTQIQWKVYDTDGSTVLATVTDAITYSGAFETSRTRTIA